MGRKARGRARPQESRRMLPSPLLLSPVSHLQTPAWHNLTSLHSTPHPLEFQIKLNLEASLNLPEIPLEPAGKWRNLRCKAGRGRPTLCVLYTIRDPVLNMYRNADMPEAQRTINHEAGWHFKVHRATWSKQGEKKPNSPSFCWDELVIIHGRFGGE